MPKYINTDGRWIRMSDADGIYYVCSECGKSLERKEWYDPQFDLFPRLKSIGKTRYCPHCGAKMDEVEDETTVTYYAENKPIQTIVIDERTDTETVYNRYTDTAGNYHWTGIYSGEHTVKMDDGERREDVKTDCL